MGDRDFHLDEVLTDDGRVTVSFSWSDAEGRPLKWGQRLRVQDGLIVGMQDYTPGRAGRRVARLFARGPE